VCLKGFLGDQFDEKTGKRDFSPQLGQLRRARDLEINGWTSLERYLTLPALRRS